MTVVRHCAIVSVMPPTADTPTDLVGTAYAATELDTSHRTIHRLVEDGTLTPALRAPGGYRGTFLFHRADIAKIKADRQAAAATGVA